MLLYNFVMKLPKISDFLDTKNSHDSSDTPKVEEMSREKFGPKKVLLSWEKELSFEEKSPISKKLTRPVIIIGIFLGFLLIIMQEFWVMLALGSIIFFFQAKMKVSPENVRYEISDHGIMIGDNLYYWDRLKRFFFMKRERSEILVVDTVMGIPGRIYIDFKESDRNKLIDIFSNYLHYLESEPRTFLDNAYDKAVQKFSFQDENEEEPNNSQLQKSKISKKNEKD